MRSALGHAPLPTARAEAPSFAAEGDQVLGAMGLAACLQKAVFQPAAFEVVLELTLYIVRHLPAMLRRMCHECRVVLIDDLIAKGLLRTIALLVATSTYVPADRPGRHMVHDPLPFVTVFILTMFI